MSHKFEVTLSDGTPYTLYEPTPKQILFHESQVTNLVAIGSRGSGKSLLLRFDAHARALSVPNSNQILIRNTFQDLQKSHILHSPHDPNKRCASLAQEMQLLGGTYHDTKHICFYPNGSRLFLSYIGDESDSMNLMSAEFIAAYFDEISLIPWEYVMKLAASVRTTDPNITAVLRAATNPLGISARDVRDYFVDKSVDPEDNPEYFPNEWDSIQINMEDNPHLPLKEYRKRFAGMPEHIRKAWLEGEFAEENALFNFRPRVYDEQGEWRDYHVIKEFDFNALKHATIYRAFDMGYFPDPAYCLWIAHLGNRYIAFHEQVWYKTVISDIATDMKAYESELRGTQTQPGPLYGKRIAITYCDPTIDINTGADVRTNKDQFEALGIPMECSINNREHYASAVHTALAEEVLPFTPRIQFYDGGKYKGCPYLIKTLPMMQFDPKHPLRLANHKHDHATVSLAYFLISSASNEQASYSSSQIRPWMKSKVGDRLVLGHESTRDR